jgi:hypothetical protein
MEQALTQIQALAEREKTHIVDQVHLVCQFGQALIFNKLIFVQKSKNNL